MYSLGTAALEIQVLNLDNVNAALQTAQVTGEQVGKQLTDIEEKSISTSRSLMLGIRTYTNLRQTIDYTMRSLQKGDPEAMLFAFMNLLQLLRNVQDMQKKVNLSMLASRAITAATAGGQAVLATLSGHPWLVAAALAAGVMVARVVASMQRGGPIGETGLYYLHRGEYVVPSSTVNRFGPIFVNVSGGASTGGDVISRYGSEIVRQSRRIGR